MDKSVKQDKAFWKEPPEDYYRLRREPDRPEPSDQPPGLRFFANLLSVIFHPLFVPGYIAAFLIFVHPYAFSGFDPKVKMLRLISVVLLTAFFPAFTVFLLRKLGFVKSLFIRSQKERIIPYIASMFFYFWIFYVCKYLPGTPATLVTMLLGVFLASIVAFLANIYFKVSMHGVAMGGMVAFFLILAVFGSFPMTFFLTLALLIAGLVCTARLIASDHHPFEVYAGCFLGIIAQTLAVFFV
jgi:hypothetical protein